MRRSRLVKTGLVALGLIAVTAAYVSYELGLRPASATGTAQEFVVAAGENAPAIAGHLVSAGLIRDRNALITYVNFHGLRPRLKVGRYLIAPTLSAAQIAQLMAG